MFARNCLARAFERRIQSGDLSRGTIGMASDLAKLTNLVFHFAQVARHCKFDETQPVLLQQLAGRAFVEHAGDDDIGPEHQHVFGASREHGIGTKILCQPGGT